MDLRKIIPNSPDKIVGSRQVKRALLSGTVRCVVLALDADASVRRTIVDAAQAVGVKIHYFPTMEELGKLCSIDVRCAVVGLSAVTD